MIGDLLAAIYLVYKFVPVLLRSSRNVVVIFSRGAFKKDLNVIKRENNEAVIITGEWLRRILRQSCPDILLEQVVCIRHTENIRSHFNLTRWVFRLLALRCCSRIVFGGVDYFEVVIFGDRALYDNRMEFVAIFHENYTIPYLKNVTKSLLERIPGHVKFDRLYCYGPPASEVLVNFCLNPIGPEARVMPRLQALADDDRYHQQTRTVNEAFASRVLLSAFAGSEYLAQICFFSTAYELAELASRKRVSPTIKFKHKREAQNIRRKMGPIGAGVSFSWSDSIESLVWSNAFVIVFNSLVLYEALLGPSIILIPQYHDSQHDSNLLQESEESIYGNFGNVASIRFLKSLDEIEAVIRQFGSAREILELVSKERAIRKAIVSRKFYLNLPAKNEFLNVQTSIVK